jgi:hypothetical protein
MKPSTSDRRAGGVAVTTALLLLPLFALVAFAVDINYVWKTDAELQHAADAAALAGAPRLLVPAVLDTQPSVVEDSDPGDPRGDGEAAVRNTAIQFAEYHQVGGTALVVNSADVQVGYIADPAENPSTSNGTFQTGTGTPFPNSVQITVRRDPTVSPGPLRLFFGGLLGKATVTRTATATATLRDQNVTGFKGSGCRLAPLAIDEASYQAMLGVGSVPAGVQVQDSKHVHYPIEDGNTSPPITEEADGILEWHLAANASTPGNIRLVSLGAVSEQQKSVYQGWFLNGPSPADLNSFGSNGLQATLSSPATMYGGPALNDSLRTELLPAIGQARIFPIVRSVQGTGSNQTLEIVGFVGAVVVQEELNISNSFLWIQLAPTIDPTATLGGGTGSSTRFVYRGISLSR